MYTETSKCQEGSSCKNSHPKCLKMKYFDRLHHLTLAKNFNCSFKRPSNRLRLLQHVR